MYCLKKQEQQHRALLFPPKQHQGVGFFQTNQLLQIYYVSHLAVLTRHPSDNLLPPAFLHEDGLLNDRYCQLTTKLLDVFNAVSKGSRAWWSR